MSKKYKIRYDLVHHYYPRLHRIQALRSFGNVKKGDIGGYIERESNLSHEGECWVGEDARIMDNTRVMGNARVWGNAWVRKDAWIVDGEYFRGYINESQGYAKQLQEAVQAGNRVKVAAIIKLLGLGESVDFYMGLK